MRQKVERVTLGGEYGGGFLRVEGACLIGCWGHWKGDGLGHKGLCFLLSEKLGHCLH